MSYPSCKDCVHTGRDISARNISLAAVRHQLTGSVALRSSLSVALANYPLAALVPLAGTAIWLTGDQCSGRPLFGSTRKGPGMIGFSGARSIIQAQRGLTIATAHIRPTLRPGPGGGAVLSPLRSTCMTVVNATSSRDRQLGFTLAFPKK
jgi:hypothetical protein